MTDGVERLQKILNEVGENFDLLELAADSRRARSLADSISATRPVRIVVVGEFNSGKSTLVNALCGVSLLPAGIIPTTATINVVEHSPIPSIAVVFTDGMIKKLPYAVETLQQFSAKNGDQQEIREVRVGLPTLPRDLVLIDTPGVNDINQIRSEIVYGMIPEADAVIFLMDIQQPLKRSEVDFLRDRILGTSVVKTVFVLNHIDRVSNPAEIRTAVEYVRNSLGTIYTDLAHSLRCAGSEHLASELLRYAIDIPVFTVSAKQMLRSCSAGKEIEGDKDGLRSEVLALVTPEVRIQTILNGVVGQAYGLVFKLHREAEEQCALYGAERDRVASELQKDCDVLRKTLEAMQQALAKVESQRTLLKSDADDAVEEVFRNASAGLPARIESHGLEKGAQVIQQEIARGLESRMEALNERIQRLATECARHAASFIAVRPSSPRIELTSHESGPQGSDWLADVLSDPVNRAGFMVLAPVAVFLFGWVGFAAVALPFVARLFGGSSNAVPIQEIQSRLLKSAEDVRRKIASTVDERLDVLSMSVLDVLDEPQQRICSASAALMDSHSTRRKSLEGVRSTATRLESEVSQIASLRMTKTGTLAAQLRSLSTNPFTKLKAAVAFGVR